MADQVACDTCGAAIGPGEKWWQVRVDSMITRDGEKKPTVFSDSTWIRANVCRRCFDQLPLADVDRIVNPAPEERRERRS